MFYKHRGDRNRGMASERKVENSNLQEHQQNQDLVGYG